MFVLLVLKINYKTTLNNQRYLYMVSINIDMKKGGAGMTLSIYAAIILLVTVFVF